MGAHRSAAGHGPGGQGPRRDRELTAGPCPEPPSAGGRVPRRRPGLKIAPFSSDRILKACEDPWPPSSSTFPPARRSASPFPAASTPAPRCTGCAARARFPTPTPPTSASPTSPTTTTSRAGRMQYGAEKARLIDCRAAARRRRHRRAAVRRLPHLDRRRDLLQHHAARPRRHRHDAGRRDEGRRRPHLGRRQHLQGQRHRALLPLRPARQPGPADLQALARPGVHRRARRPRRDVGVHDRRPASPTRCRPRRRTRPTPTCWARRTRPRTSSSSTSGIKIVQPIMGVAFWKDEVAVKREEVTRALRGRPAGRAERQRPSPTRSS